MIKVKIEIDHGSRYVTQDDIYRAEESALAEAAKLGIADQAALERLYADYRAALDEGEDPKGGWERINSAADCALTEGWRNSEGAFCSVVPA